MRKRDDAEVIKEFKKRQTRQIIAAAAAIFFVLLVAVIRKRADIFGVFSPGSLFGVQAIVIAVFLGFTAVNWRCPSCGKHLGGDIFRRVCRRCGVRLQ